MDIHNQVLPYMIVHVYIAAAMGVMICYISPSPQGLDLRVEHTHCYSDHGEGGHYHCDVTPDHVEYHGYYTVAEKLFRIDQPKDTHTWGRD